MEALTGILFHCLQIFITIQPIKSISYPMTSFIYAFDFWVTTDGGSSWNKVDESPKPTFRKIQFLDKYLGFAVGGDGYSGGSSFYKTNNGGYTGNYSYQGNPNSVYDEFFMLDSLNGWLVDFNQLFKTTDGGINWNEVYVDSILEFIRGVEFYSKEFGILYEVRQRFVDYPIAMLLLMVGRPSRAFNHQPTGAGVLCPSYQVNLSNT
ncbi:MAG: hypothetical protein MZV64_64285 [Ignavibacteriales bacterium]|nr:hypothetical protein [Ignavibacteriales bacterium]